MAIKYEIDGNIFREINEKWLVAYVNEYLIKVRTMQTDVEGNRVELLQLNDGRIFSRTISPHFDTASVPEPKTQPRILQSASGG